ncbi:unnamed protein product [Microthlaspi erraticum]|uniref:AMP-dependent synthetase/ligase domain-containing protein n=1 Tax=Microthlaspi erraticum TaxID=1685480 RepID=A0A6D2I622_9BRAS|nr:unnamed protein product [Microthlaspi erraticum]
MHFAVPMAGAVLNTINTRLDEKSIAGILCHAQPKMLFIDRNLEHLARESLQLLPHEDFKQNMKVIFIDESKTSSIQGVRLRESHP